MKFLIALTICALTLPSFAAPTAKKVRKDKYKAKLGTEFEFTGSDVTGKYQVAGEGLSIVENEKVLEQLVEPRREFDDRLKTSKRWNK